MKKAISLFSMIVLIALQGCDLFDDSPCGPKENLDIYLLGSSIVDTTTGYYSSYLSNGERVFQYSTIVENVCAEEHVKVDYRVALLDETTTGISARGRVDWLFFFEKQIPMNKNGSDIKGKGEAGLKQAFGEEAGWFIPVIEIYFPTHGSYGLDTAFLKENVISVECRGSYRKF